MRKGPGQVGAEGLHGEASTSGLEHAIGGFGEGGQRGGELLLNRRDPGGRLGDAALHSSDTAEFCFDSRPLNREQTKSPLLQSTLS